jgi:hypothetical protein
MSYSEGSVIEALMLLSFSKFLLLGVLLNSFQVAELMKLKRLLTQENGRETEKEQKFAKLLLDCSWAKLLMVSRENAVWKRKT